MSRHVFTQGIAVEYDYLDVLLATKGIKNPDMLGSIKLARGMKAQVVVLAGQIRSKKTGCFATISKDGTLIVPAIHAANERMRELGSTKTAWFICGSEEFKDSIRSELSFIADTTGGSVEEVSV